MMALDRCAHCRRPIADPRDTVFVGAAADGLQYVHRECFRETKAYAEESEARQRLLEAPPRTDTLIFLIAVGAGGWIGWHAESLSGAVTGVLAATAILGTVAIMLPGLLLTRLVPPSMRSPYGITVPRGRVSYIFGGTIATIGVVAVFAALLRQFTR
jgi:hypothetical protein